MHIDKMSQNERQELETAIFWLHNFTGAKNLLGELIMINGESFEVTGLHIDEHRNIELNLVDTVTKTCHSVDARLLLKDWIYLPSITREELLRKAVEIGICEFDEDYTAIWNGTSYYIETDHEN